MTTTQNAICGRVTLLGPAPHRLALFESFLTTDSIIFLIKARNQISIIAQAFGQELNLARCEMAKERDLTILLVPPTSSAGARIDPYYSRMKINLRKPGTALKLSLFLSMIFFAYNLLNFRERNFDGEELIPPAPLANVFGSGHTSDFRVEENFEKPLVFMVSSSSTDSLMPQKHLQRYPFNEDNVVFIYSQGTYRNISRGAKKDNQYKLDVTACLIGENEYPIFVHSFGVYACIAKAPPSNGDEISLIVSSKIYLHVPINKTLENDVVTLIRANNNNKKLRDGNKRRFALPSTVKWNGQKDGEASKRKQAKYEICAMTQERLFPELLRPWIEYHRRIGIDRFYIYDNAGEKNLTKELKERNDTEVVYWPWPRSQLQAQNHWILHGRRRCHWMIMFDVDEYIGLRMKGPWRNSLRPQPGQLKMYVRYAKKLKISELSLNQIKMGPSGCRKQQWNVAPPEVFIHKLANQEKTPKSIFYGMHTLPDTRVHSVRQYKWYTYRTFNLSEEDVAPFNSFGIVHFTQRSWEEQVRKIHGPRSSYQVKNSRSRLDAKKPVGNYLVVKDELKFEKFRKIYGATMRLIRQPPTPVLLPADEDQYNKAVFRCKRKWHPDTPNLQIRPHIVSRAVDK